MPSTTPAPSVIELTKAILLFLVLSGLLAGAAAADEPPQLSEMSLLVEEDFEKGADRWQPTDPKAWKVIEQDGDHVYSQHGKSKYKPPVRSPHNISLLKDVIVGDFVLKAKLQSTIRDYGHRDMCLFFGYQDSSHFYYVHLGKKTDDHANQIFIVDGKPRTKISTKTTSGTPWDDQWHQVMIVRTVDSGVIQVYFDDMTKPVMTAKDKTFTWGQIGIGSFDDTGNWDDIKLYGNRIEKPSE